MAITVAHWKRLPLRLWQQVADRWVADRAGESGEEAQQHDGQQNKNAAYHPWMMGGEAASQVEAPRVLSDSLRDLQLTQNDLRQLALRPL